MDRLIVWLGSKVIAFFNKVSCFLCGVGFGIRIGKPDIVSKKNNCSIKGKIYCNNSNIKLGKNVEIYPGVTFGGDGSIEIGDDVSIGSGTIIMSSKENGGVYIGEKTLVAANVYIIDSDHGIAHNMPIKEQRSAVSRVHIGSDVWIATGCIILRGSTIQNGAVIGANSVVKGEIPENAIAVGSPVTVKKFRR